MSILNDKSKPLTELYEKIKEFIIKNPKFFNKSVLSLFFPGIFFVIGILYQYVNLISLDGMNYFSWSQVINDTVAFFLPTVYFILTFLLGITVIYILLYKYGKKYTFSDFITNLRISISFFFIVSIILLFLIKFLNGSLSLLTFPDYSNSFNKAIFLMSILGFSSGVFGVVSGVVLGKILDFYYPAIFTLLIVLSLFGFVSIFNHLKEFNYNNLCVQFLEKGQSEEVKYFNDRYIITTVNIYERGNENIRFYELPGKNKSCGN